MKSLCGLSTGLDGKSLDWTLPIQRRNTSKENFERLPSGNKVETCCRFVATLFPLRHSSSNKEEIYFHFVAALLPPCCHLQKTINSSKHKD